MGITKQKPLKRWKNGIGYKSSPHFWNAIQKYGWENIEHVVLYAGLSKKQACEKERELINELKATDRQFGYNEKTGGEIGVKFTDSVKKKISDSLKKRFLDPKERELCSIRATGRKHTDEERAKMSAAKIGSHFTMTESWKNKIGESNRIAYGAGTAARETATKRCVENGMKQSLKVEQCDQNWSVIDSFNSLHDAERKTGIRNGNISKCCNGKALSAGGYKWRLAAES